MPPQVHPAASHPVVRRVVVAVLATASVAVVAVCDHALHDRLVLSNLYLAPVAAAAWYGGLASGLFAAGVATTAAALAPDHGADLLGRVGMPLVLNVCLGWVVATLRVALGRERTLARTDALTGLWNRRAFDETARIALREHRRSGRSLTAVCIDLDGFKAVNDTLGHAEGDNVLRAVADAIQRSVRGTDVVARYGGDEFSLLLPDTDERGAKEVLDRIRGAVGNAMAARGWRVTSSIGAVTFRGLPRNERDLMAPVDAQMYAAKNAGKDRVVHEIREARRAG